MGQLSTKQLWRMIVSESTKRVFKNSQLIPVIYVIKKQTIFNNTWAIKASRCLCSNRGTNGGAMAPYQSKVCHLQGCPLEFETQLRNFALTTDKCPLTTQPRSLLQVRISNSLSTCWVKHVSWNGPWNVWWTVRFELAIKTIPRDAELQTSVIMSKITVKVNE